MPDDLEHFKPRYDAIAHQIDREDQLAHSRVWILLAVIAGQIAVVAAFSAELTGSDNLLAKAVVLLSGIGGMCLSLTTFSGVNAAFKQIHELFKGFVELKKRFPITSDLFPQPFGDEGNHKHGKLALLAVPYLGFVFSLALIFGAICSN